MVPPYDVMVQGMPPQAAVQLRGHDQQHQVATQRLECWRASSQSDPTETKTLCVPDKEHPPKQRSCPWQWLHSGHAKATQGQ